MKLIINLDSVEEGGFNASVPSLHGCFSQGEIKEEALRKIKEAVELYSEGVRGKA